jgi:hypothetical protein
LSVALQDSWPLRHEDQPRQTRVRSQTVCSPSDTNRNTSRGPLLWLS